MNPNIWILSALLLLLQYKVGNCAYFTGCDYVYNINAGVSYLQSPYFPNNYPAGTSCRYKFIAPLDYYIELRCDVNIFSTSAGCTTDNLYLDRDGDTQLRGSENFCGTGRFNRQSVFRSLVLAYISTSSNTGKFNCSLTAKPQACDCGWSVNTRIVNGQQASANEFPSMAALKDITGNQQSFCGASIISHNHLVSAAHCTQLVSNVQNIVAIVGTNDLANPASSKFYAQYAIQQIYIHEQYKTDPYTINDIAIFVTKIPIDWSRGVGPVCLPPPSTTDNFQYDTVNVIGWGTTSFAGPTSSQLLKAELMIVSNTDCQTEYRPTVINDGQVCTYDYSGNSRDSCQYDSGGPVILPLSRKYIIGIISFGKNCAAGSYPMGVNTRITYYINWIRQKIGYSNCPISTIS